MAWIIRTYVVVSSTPVVVEDIAFANTTVYQPGAVFQARENNPSIVRLLEEGAIAQTGTGGEPTDGFLVIEGEAGPPGPTGPGAFNDLETTLGIGNFTGANDIVVTSGQQISGGRIALGTSTTSAADGDFSAGDGTRDFSWDASTGALSAGDGTNDFAWSAATGLLQVTGAIDGLTGLLAANSSAGTSAYSSLVATSDTSDLGLYAYSSTHASKAGVVEIFSGAAGNSMRVGATSAVPLELWTSGSHRWSVNPAGFLIAATDNIYDIGIAAVNRPRTLFLGTSLDVGTTTGATAHGDIKASDGVYELSWDASEGLLTVPNLEVSGTTTIINTEIQTADNYILLNADYTLDTPQPSGLLMNVDPAATSFSISGIAANVITVAAGDPSAVLSAADFILIQDPADPSNAGVYEVLSATISSITIDTTPVEPFSGNALTDDPTAQGTVVGVGLTVWESSSAGSMQGGFGTSAPITRTGLIASFDFLNVGSATEAVSTGDLASGDGTRELFYDASGGVLILDTTTALTNLASNQARLRQVHATSGAPAAGFGSIMVDTHLATNTGGANGDRAASVFATRWLDATDTNARSETILLGQVGGGNYATMWRVHSLANSESTVTVGGIGTNPTTGLTQIGLTGNFVARNASDAVTIDLDGAGFARIGSTTAATALGDLASGDGTRLMFYDASGGALNLDTTTALTNLATNQVRIRQSHATSGVPAANFGAIMFGANLATNTGGANGEQTASLFATKWLDATNGNARSETAILGQVGGGNYATMWRVHSLANSESTVTVGGIGTNPTTGLTQIGLTGNFVARDTSDNVRAHMSGVGWLNLGNTVTAASIGDISAGDGTRELFWDASSGKLNVGEGYLHVGAAAGAATRGTASTLGELTVGGTNAGLYFNPNGQLQIEARDTNTTGTFYPLTLLHTLSSGTAAVGMGVGITSEMPDAVGQFTSTGRLRWLWSNPANGAETTNFQLELPDNGTLNTLAMRVRGADQVTEIVGGVEVGSPAGTAALGDIVAGDGTREMFWDASSSGISITDTATSSHVHAANTSWYSEKSGASNVIRFRSYSTTANDAGTFLGQRSRGTPGSESDVLAGDYLSTWAGQGTNQTTVLSWSQIVMQADPAGTVSTVSMPSKINFWTIKDGSRTNAGSPDGMFPRWQINNQGHLLTETEDNAYDIGADGATRPRSGYFGTALNVGNGITASTANGDLVAGDGTRSLTWDASAGELELDQGFLNIGTSAAPPATPLYVDAQANGDFRGSDGTRTFLWDASDGYVIMTDTTLSVLNTIVRIGSPGAARFAGLYGNSGAGIVPFTEAIVINSAGTAVAGLGSTLRWKVETTAADNAHGFMGDWVQVVRDPTAASLYAQAEFRIHRGQSAGSTSVAVAPALLTLGNSVSATGNARAEFANSSDARTVIIDMDAENLTIGQSATAISGTGELSIGDGANGNLRYLASAEQLLLNNQVALTNTICTTNPAGASFSTVKWVTGASEAPGAQFTVLNDGGAAVAGMGSTIRFRAEVSTPDNGHAPTTEIASITRDPNAASFWGQHEVRVSRGLGASLQTLFVLGNSTTATGNARAEFSSNSGVRTVTIDMDAETLTVGSDANNYVITQAVSGSAISTVREVGSNTWYNGLNINTFNSAAVGGAGLGGRVNFQAESSDSNLGGQGYLELIWRDATNAAEYAQASIGVTRNGVFRNLLTLGNTTTATGNARAEFSSNSGAGTITLDMDAVSLDFTGAASIDGSSTLTIGGTSATGLTIGRSGVTTDFPSGSTVDFTGATVTGLAGGSVTNLQTAYEGGNTIVTDGTNGAFDVSGTEAISLDASAASNFTVTGSGLDLTLEAAGGGAGQQVIVNSAGTGTAAIRLNASAGGLDIDGTRCDISTSGAFTNAIRMNAVGGGIDIDADFSISIQSDQAGGGAVSIGAPTGGVDVSAGTGSSVLTLGSSGTGTNAIDVNAINGGMTIDASTGFSIDATNASSSNVTCTNTTASTNTTLTVSAVNTGATSGDATVLLDASSVNGTGVINVGPTSASTLNIGRAAGSIGFFGATAVGQQTDIGALTDSTGGTADNTVAAVSGSGDDATINNNFADLIDQINQLRDTLRNLGLMA